MKYKDLLRTVDLAARPIYLLKEPHESRQPRSPTPVYMIQAVGST